MEAGRKPDYKVSLVIEGEYFDVGAAWVNDSRTISITLDAFISISVGPKVKLMMIPKDFKK